MRFLDTRSIGMRGLLERLKPRVSQFAPLALLGISIAPAFADDQAPARAAFHAAEGQSVVTWAETPLLHNPTNIDIDARGRVWVTEGVTYRGFRNDTINSTFGRRGDRVVILEDTDGDGRADSSKVFVEDEDLVAPMGISILGDRVVVSCAPSVIVYTDRDGDDKPDDKQVFLTGFAGFDHDHSLHTVVGGPDGRWYLTCGNTGPTIVTDRDGFTFRSGCTYNGGSPYNTENRAGLVSDDHRMWVGGAALRIEPDGTSLTCVGHNFRNPYEMAVDAYGNMWQNDNDDTTSCRIAWLMEGGNGGFASADGTRTWRADQRPGQATSVAHWHQDDPGVMPYGDITGAGSPTGIAVYERGLLGEGYEETILSCDAGQNRVFVTRPIADGAGYAWRRSTLVTSIPADAAVSSVVDDDRFLFRPTDVAVGVDGAVYVADWYDSHIGGHKLTDPLAYGRILRIAPAGQPSERLEPARLDSIEGAIAGLSNPAAHVRHAAAERLRQEPTAALPRLLALAREGKPTARARAMWLLADSGAKGIAEVERTLADPGASDDVRIAAFRALRRVDHEVLAHAAKLCREPSEALRREVAIALRDVPLDDCRDTLLVLATRVDGADRWSVEAFGTACDRKAEGIWPAIVNRFGDPAPLEWTKHLAAIAWRVHPIAAIAALAERASAERLPLETRKQAIDALAFIIAADAADAMVDLVRNGPSDTRDYCAWWVRDRHTNDWQDFKPADRLPSVMRLAGKPDFSSGPTSVGRSHALDIDISGATSVTLLVAESGDRATEASAAWLGGRVITLDGEVPLTSLERHAVETNGETSSGATETAAKGDAARSRAKAKRRSKNDSLAPSAVIAASDAEAIVVGVPSEVVFQLPRGALRLVAECRLDSLTTPDRQVEFFVLADRNQWRERLVTYRSRLVKRETPLADKLKLAEQLASTSSGGMMLVELAASGRLDSAVRDAVAPAMFRNTDPTVRALATGHFPRPLANGQNLPSVAELLAMPASAERGRDIFKGEKAGCVKCHTHTGVGGQIGPDLSKIGTQFDRARILDSILNPSAAIALGYESFAIETDSGQVIVGMIVADGQNVVVRAADGSQTVFPADEIAARQRLAASTMPDNISTGLSPQELVDVLEFLATSRGN